MNPRYLSFVATASLAILATACSGNTVDESSLADDSEESALAVGDLANVAAVRVEVAGERNLVGEPGKLAKLMKAFRKSTGPTPLCGMRMHSTKFTFYDVKGEEVGTGSVLCFRGSIHLKSGKDIAFVTRSGDLAVLQEPMVVADGLWGVTKVHARAREKSVDVTKKAEIGSFLDAVGVKQTFGPPVPVTRCPPRHGLDFYRGSTVVGSGVYDCGLDAPATLSINFRLPDPADAAAEPIAEGSITIRAKDIENLIAPASE